MNTEGDPAEEEEEKKYPTYAHVTDWPYIPQYLQASLDANLIEAHGEALLRRALNTGRIVCFVGSGISMAYGRIGWGDLVRRLVGAEQAKSKDLKDPLVMRLLDTLEEMRLDASPGSDGSRGSRYPVAFQFAEQIADAPSSRAAKRSTEVGFREHAQQLLYDDRGHAHLLFKDLLEDLNTMGGTKGSRKEVGIDAEQLIPLTAPERLTRRALYSMDAADPGLVPSPWTSFFEISGLAVANWKVLADGQFTDPETGTLSPHVAHATKLLETMGEKFGIPGADSVESKGLAPLHRFVIPAALRLCAELRKVQPQPQPETEKEMSSASPSAGPVLPLADMFQHPLTTGHHQTRAETIPAPRDPLALLAGGLGISRFITTNYDLDIERLLRDRGFSPGRHKQPHGAQRLRPADAAVMEISDALGAEARDSVFRAEQALELVEFSVHNPDHAFNVVHLHGRATHGDQMVVTERDYLDRYLQKGDEADMVNIAISLAFAANPVLFVGSGMSEDDILRPLRQFVAERRSRADRKAIVLLPAGASRGSQIEETVRHYSRFGVFTVHYGFATFSGADEVPGPTTNDEASLPMPQRHRWLAWVQDLCGALTEWNDKFLDHLTGKDADALGDLVELSCKLQKAWNRSQRNSQEATTPTWHRMVSAPKDGEALSLNVPQSIDGMRVVPRGELDPEPEMALLSWLLNFVVDAARQCCGTDLPPPAKAQQPAPGAGSGAQRLAWHRLALTARAMLRELPAALTGLCLCAKLASIREEWLSWKQRGEQLPKPRPNGGPRWLVRVAGSTEESKPELVRLLARHPIVLRAFDASSSAQSQAAPPGDRFLENSPSRTFHTFAETLRQACARSGSALSWAHERSGRRVFVLLATRGVGKGHFFETLRMPPNIAEFRDKSWPEGKAPSYVAHVHFNLSFCHEVVSVFDRLANVLVERAHSVFTRQPPSRLGPAELIWNASARLKHNRVGRLSKILSLYAQHAGEAEARVAVAFNGFNFLFDERGFPKNAQLFRLVGALLGDDAARAPIDFILVCSEAGFPRWFRQSEAPPPLQSHIHIEDEWSRVKPLAMEHLIHTDSGEKGEREVVVIAKRLRLHIGDPTLGLTANTGVRPGKLSAAFFHVLRGARASSTISKYFPEVALAIAAQPGCLQRAGGSPDDRTRITIPRTAQLEQQLQKSIFKHDHKKTRPGATTPDAMPGALRDLAVRGDVKAIAANANPHAARADLWQQDNLDMLFANPHERPVDPPNSVHRTIGNDFKHLFRELDRNRFLLTIVCAAAAESAWSAEREPSGPWQELEPQRITGWLRKLLAEHVGDAPTQRIDAVIATVLALYRDRHESGMVLPEACGVRETLQAGLQRPGARLPNDFGTQSPNDGDQDLPKDIIDQAYKELAGPAGWIVQQQVLWHLAVVGHPVEADVLAEAPKIRHACLEVIIRAACAAANCSRAKLGEREWRDPLKRELTLLVVTICIDLLVRRCLVFRLGAVRLDGREADVRGQEPVGLNADAASQEEDLTLHREERQKEDKKEEANTAPAGEPQEPPLWRFALHRSVQRAIFRRLHSPYVEYPQVDQFSLSMWATQPDELPRPNATAARDIAELMAEWTGFPHGVAAVDRTSTYHRALEEALPKRVGEAGAAARMSLPARMLRAAFGVVRSVYSVGVVSRYHDSDSPASPRAPIEGYVEQHRLQIRWMLRKAADLQNDAAKWAKAALDHKLIVDLGTAESPFFAEEIAWLYNECGLLSLVEGRLEAAAGLFRRALRAARVIEARSECGALWSRVHLNMAIVDIERGRIRTAKAYLTTIRGTKDENPILRLLAHGFIGLTEHLAGDLDLAERIYKEVILDLEGYGQSRSIAIFSRHLGELYRMQGPTRRDLATAAIDRAIARAAQGGHEDIRQLVRLSRVRLRIDRLPADDTGGVQRELDSIEQYGRRMGMPRLMADVAYARATYLLNLGETHHASTLAATSLEIATANDLRLRQVTALSLLAKTCERRGLQASSAALVARAEQLAESCNYASARASASRRTPQRTP